MIILISLIVNILATSIILAIFIAGIKLGKQLEQSGVNVSIIPEKTVKPPKPSKDEQKRINETLERTQTIWDNINNYDGTESSQKEVK